MKVVCLSSGGIDSSVILFMLKEKKHDVYPLYIDYGHKSANIEIKSLKEICRRLKVEPKIFQLQDISSISSGLTSPNISHVDNPYFPNRNLLFLTIASAYAHRNSIRVISIGLLDNVNFPDQSKNFLNKAEDSISEGLGYKIKILAPLIELDKREVVGLAKKHDIPLELTYSCYSGNEMPCNICKACQERNLAVCNPVKQ